MEDLDENGIPDDLESYMAENSALPDDYDPSSTDSDMDGMSDLMEWILGLDPLTADEHLSTTAVSSTNSSGSVALAMSLPDYFGNYAEVFGKSDLIYDDSWENLSGWIPVYGASEVSWDMSTNQAHYFFMIFDATQDFDGDGYSDHMEYFITGTDPYTFNEVNEVNEDGDNLHDWYEIMIFGDIWTQTELDDSDGDSLLNGEELVWASSNTVYLLSDPSLADTDAEGLGDAEEGVWGTSPLDSDTDGDGLSDADEVLAALRTDPNNPDADTPFVSFN